MRLISCRIENFGKLSNVTYDFSGECNTICEDNGWGKSTLASFIRVMFYGFKNENKKKLSEKERNRFMPWQKGVYGGEIIFEAEGVTYSVRRVFGHKQAEDEYVLTRKDTNMPCDDYSSNLGEELFKIDAQSFERTVFIAQSDCVTTTTDSINAKIGNLADNTDDINNFETVIDRFQKMLNKLSATRATGSMSKRKTRITELKSQLNNYSDIDKTIAEQIKIRDEFCEKKDYLKRQRSELEKKQSELSRKKDYQAGKEKYQMLVKDCEDKKNALDEIRKFFKGEIPQREAVVEQIDILEQAGAIGGKISHFTADEENRLKDLESVFATGIPDEAVINEYSSIAKRIGELKKQIETRKLSQDEQDRIKALEEQFAAGIPDDSRINKLHDIWMSSEKKETGLTGKEMALNIAKETELSRQENARAYKNQYMPGIIIGAVAAIAGAVLIPFVMGLGIAVLVAGAVLCIISAGLGAARKKEFQAGQEQIGAQAEKKIKMLESEINDDRVFIESARKLVKEFCDEYGIPFNKDTVAWEISRIYQNIKDYRELNRRASELEDDGVKSELDNLNERMKAFFERYDIQMGSAADNYELAMEKLNNNIADYYRLREGAENRQKLKQDYESKIAGVNAFLNEYTKDSDDSLSDRLRILDKRIDEYHHAKAGYDAAIGRLSDFEKENGDSVMALVKEDEGIKDTAPKGAATGTGADSTLEDIAFRLNQTSEEIETLGNNINECNKHLEILQEQMDECESSREALEELEQTQTQEKKMYELLKKTKEIMEESKQTFTSKYMEPVMSGFRHYYKVLTGHEPDDYQIDADTRLTVVEQNLPREIDCLSAGRQDLIGVCMRMALVQAMYKDEKPFLIFDDPFVNLDDNNIQGGMRLLNEIAKDYQVIYFTCSESRINN